MVYRQVFPYGMLFDGHVKPVRFRSEVMFPKSRKRCYCSISCLRESMNGHPGSEPGRPAFYMLGATQSFDKEAYISYVRRCSRELQITPCNNREMFGPWAVSSSSGQQEKSFTMSQAGFGTGRPFTSFLPLAGRRQVNEGSTSRSVRTEDDRKRNLYPIKSSVVSSRFPP